MSPGWRLLLSVGVLLAVFLVGTAGYMLVEQAHHPTFTEAAYMTVITLSTVGFEEVWELSPAGRLWTIGVITFGVATVSYALMSLVALIVSGEIRSQRESRRMQAKIEHLSGHVILCGFGRMAPLVLEELTRRRLTPVVVDLNQSLEVQLREANTPFLIGDATEEEILLQAGLLRANALVAALPHDADNVYITLTARTLNPDLWIIARAEQPTTEAKLLKAGASRVICPQIIGANRIADLLTRPNVVDFVEVATKGVQLEMDEYVIGGQSPLDGRALRDSLVREKSGAIVVAIKRADGEAVFNPGPETGLAAGDTLILVGPEGVSSRLDAI